MTMWRVTGPGGEEVKPSWWTPDGEHPRDNWGGWIEGVHDATEIPAGCDPVRQSWDGIEYAADPAKARDRRWQEAKAYYGAMCSGSFPLPPFGSIQLGTGPEGEPARGIDAIKLLYDEALERIAANDTAWSTLFKNEANDWVPVSAVQIQLIYRLARAYLGACYTANQAVRDRLDAALAGGATADEISAIEIDTGYPSTGAPDA